MENNFFIKTMLAKRQRFKKLIMLYRKPYFIIMIILIILMTLVVWYLSNIRNSAKESYYKEVIATVDEQEIFLEEFNYFLNDLYHNICILHKTDYDQSIIQEIKNFEVRQVLLADIEGKSINGVKMSEQLKSMVFNLIVEYKVQCAKASKDNIILGQSDIRLIEAKIRSQKRAGVGSLEEKKEFFRNQYGIGTEEAYKSILINTMLIEKLKNKLEDQEYKKIRAVWFQEANVSKMKTFW